MASPSMPHPADIAAQLDLLRAKVNASPLLTSLLYDIDLLPEQIKDGDLRRWGYVAAIIGHIETLERDDARMDWIEENCKTVGGGSRMMVTFHTPDSEYIRGGIDLAMKDA